MSHTDLNNAYLVGFSDASEKGYSAVVYLVVHGKTIKSTLILAKSKVAPLKTLSIPRLELCGALLLSRLLQYLLKVFKSTFHISEIFAFTDSSNVLFWLKTSPNLLKTFVATRVSQIITIISPSCWHHVSTSFNPADCSSRGLLPSQLIEHPLWWQGPHWLSSPLSEWPIHSPIDYRPSTISEMKPHSTICSFISSSDSAVLEIEKFSSFTKVQRVTAWCLRFRSNLLKTPDRRLFGPLSGSELQESLTFLIKRVQQEYFGSEIHDLSQGKTCRGSMQRLAPFVDQEGVLRVGGRLKHARLPVSSTHPILLPKSCHFVYLLIDYYHLKYLHLGPRALQSLILRKFWILSARSTIRYRLSKCVPCFKARAMPNYPLMGDLPQPRVVQGRPFINVGIDFGGPFYIKESKRRNAKVSKAYLALFVCFASKAVHLELVTDLSTDAFLAAFERFVSRRGLCHNVYTDCGTNFVGASRRLNEYYDFLNSSSKYISDHLAEKRIKWCFNVPSAPHLGGLWERGIRSTKHHLHRVLNDRALTYEEMSTLFTKIESILNSRPLCPLSNDPSEIDVLTPGHFLIGGPIIAAPEPDLEEVPLSHLDRWQHITKVTQHFWNRWSRDYLHTLQQRSKWFTSIPNLKVGDLVLLVEKTPSRKWRTGRVEAVYPGGDGIVRVASVRTTDGTYLRPVVKLCPFPIS